MNSIWAPVIAALGASMLTGFFTYWHAWRLRRHEQQANAGRAKAVTYGVLLARSLRVVVRIGATGELMRLRSGLRERLDLTLHHRKPVDVLEMHNWLNEDFGPLVDAWSQILVVGSQEAIVIANQMISICAELMELVLKPDPNRSSVRRYLQGERWTPAQREGIEAVQKRLGEERFALAALARKELGNEIVAFGLERGVTQKELEERDSESPAPSST